MDTFFDAISDASANQDLDDAISAVQKALGVEVGDVASHWWDEVRRKSWWACDHDDHRAMMLAKYAAHELAWQFNGFDATGRI